MRACCGLARSSTVDSDELRDKVIEMTRAVPGVLGVIDEIIVVRIAHRYGAV